MFLCIGFSSITITFNDSGGDLTSILQEVEADPGGGRETSVADTKRKDTQKRVLPFGLRRFCGSVLIILFARSKGIWATSRFYLR